MKTIVVAFACPILRACCPRPPSGDGPRLCEPQRSQLAQDVRAFAGTCRFSGTAAGHRPALRQMCQIGLALTWCVAFQIHASSADEWTATAPREEIRPQFHHRESGGKSGHGALAIRADDREGLHGWWQKTFTVTAGQHYRFSAWRRAKNVAVPRRSVLARVLWRDEAGKEVQRREGVLTNFAKSVVASAEPEYPRDMGDKGASNDGWIEMSGVYQAPPGATRARVELHLL
jgi:hypothetical protein